MRTQVKPDYNRISESLGKLAMFKGKLLKLSILVLLLFAFALPAGIFAAFPEEGYAQSSEQPSVSIINTTSEFMDVIVRFPPNPLGSFPYNLVFDETVYSRPSDVGVPDLPVLRRNIEFPTGNYFTVEILESRSSIQTLGENDLPAIIPERPAEVQKCEFDENCEEPNFLEELDKQSTIENPDEINESEILEPENPDEPINEPDGIEPPGEETGNPGDVQDPGELDDPVNPDEDQVTDDQNENELEEIIIEEEVVDEISLNPENLFPSTPARLADSYVIRGHQIGLMEFWPVQYDPESQMVIIYEELVVRINFLQDGIRTQSVSSMAYSSEIFNEILASEVINFDPGIRTQSKSATTNEAILIVAPDAFMSTANALVNLKQSQGHPVSMVGLSTTGTTPNAIKNYIQNAYNTWSPPLTYVILIGDVNNSSNTMPAYTGASTQTVTDLYYGTVDGSDWIPDVFVGRLPARTTSQLNIMINNLATYNNLSGSENWVKKAAFLASNDPTYWSVAEATQNYVIDTHTKPAGYTGTFPSNPIAGGDKLYAYTYSAGNSHTVSAINNGRALISYTGHGSRISWGGPSYNQSNIRSINTSDALSVVTSFACVTGDFNTTESFGETWMIQPGKGAVTFIGSSANSYWGADDILERAMMNYLFSSADSANIVSNFLYAGLMAVHQQRPGTGTAQSRYYWETYNLLGDPSLRMNVGPQDYMPKLSSSKLTVSQAPGSDIKVQLQLTNAGSKSDSYNMDKVTNNWLMNVEPRSVISLSPGESATIEFYVSIPADAEFGQSEQFTLTFTSQSDLSAKASALIEIKAGILNFIPLVIRP